MWRIGAIPVPRPQYSLVNYSYETETMTVKWISDQMSTTECASHVGRKHYANTPMQYNEIFYGCKNDNFQTKKL